MFLLGHKKRKKQKRKKGKEKKKKRRKIYDAKFIASQLIFAYKLRINIARKKDRIKIKIQRYL